MVFNRKFPDLPCSPTAVVLLSEVSILATWYITTKLTMHHSPPGKAAPRSHDRNRAHDIADGPTRDGRASISVFAFRYFPDPRVQQLPRDCRRASTRQLKLRGASNLLAHSSQWARGHTSHIFHVRPNALAAYVFARAFSSASHGMASANVILARWQSDRCSAAHTPASIPPIIWKLPSICSIFFTTSSVGFSSASTVPLSVSLSAYANILKAIVVFCIIILCCFRHFECIYISRYPGFTARCIVDDSGFSHLRYIDACKR